MSIWVPTSIQEAKDMASLLSPSAPHNLLLLHAALGHHFNGDMGLVMAQGYVLKGKASLGADAMAGIVRSQGKCDFIRVVEWTDQLCSMEMKRIDEAEPHRFTFTLSMAQKQNLTRGPSWRSMPMQMLRARCLTMGLRAVFPDSVSGLYSTDEMADADQTLTDHQRATVQAQSLGEEVPSRPPQAVAPPSVPPQSQQPPQIQPRPHQTPQPPHAQPRPQQTTQPLIPNKLYDFSCGVSFSEFKRNWGIDDAAASAALDKCDISSIADREAFSYGRLSLLSLIASDAPNDWYTYSTPEVDLIHKGVVAQYGAIAQMRPSFYGPRLSAPAWMEAMRLVSMMKDETKIQEGRSILETMHPLDWNSYDQVKNLDSQVTKSEVDAHKAKASHRSSEEPLT